MSDVLARNFTGPQKAFEIVNVSGRQKSLAVESPQFDERADELAKKSMALLLKERIQKCLPLQTADDNSGNDQQRKQKARKEVVWHSGLRQGLLA